MASQGHFELSLPITIIGGLLAVAIAVITVLTTLLVFRADGNTKAPTLNSIEPTPGTVSAPQAASVRPQPTATPPVISYADASGNCQPDLEMYAVYATGALVCVNLQTNPYINGVQVWRLAPCGGKGEDWATGGCDRGSRNEDCEPRCTDGFTPHCGSRVGLVRGDIYYRDDAWLAKGLDPSALTGPYPILCT